MLMLIVTPAPGAASTRERPAIHRRRPQSLAAALAEDVFQPRVQFCCWNESQGKEHRVAGHSQANICSWHRVYGRVLLLSQSEFAAPRRLSNRCLPGRSPLSSRQSCC